jgi:hypothetical protein
VLTPDEVRALAATGAMVLLKPLLGGLDPEVGWASLRSLPLS